MTTEAETAATLAANAPAKVGREASVAPAGAALGDLKRRSAVGLAILSAVSLTMVYVAMAPILPKIAGYFGGGGSGEFIAELGASAASVGIMLGSLCAGWLLKRVGTRRVVMAAILGYGLSGLIGYVAQDIWTFGAARVLAGFAGACWTTASVALLSHLYTERGRATMIGFWTASGGASVFLLMLASGATAQAFGWRASFLLFTAGAVISFIVAVFAVPPGRLTSDERSDARTPLNLAPLLPVFLLIFVLQAVLMTTSIQLPFLVASKGLSSSTRIALALSFAPPVTSLAAAGSGVLQSRFGIRPVLWIGVALTAAGALIMGSAPGLVVLVIGNMVMALGIGLYMPVLMTLPISRAPENHRELVIGLAQAICYLGAFLNPAMVAPLRKAFGIGGAFTAIGLLCAVALVLATPFMWRRKAGTAA